MRSGPNFTAVASDSGIGETHQPSHQPVRGDATAGSRGTLTKAELADLLFEKVGFNKREAKDMVESFFEEVRTALERGEGVKLSGFGNFQLRDKPQRPGRNPKTGEEIPITARRVVTFHASQKLKALVDKHYPADGQQQSQS
jgi:integration host factor subunit alpha